MLDRQAILGADDLAVEPLDVPEWGGQVYIRMMTSEERDTFELSGHAQVSGDAPIQLRATLAVRCVCDESGTRLFKDSDTGLLAKKSGKALDRIYEAARRLNRMTDDDVEELVKNLESCQSDDSACS